MLGDIQAFDELVLRYRAAVYRLAQLLVGAELAEDVAQDAFLLAFKALPSIEDPAKFPSWLYAITRHRALRLGQREQAGRRVELDEVLLEHSPALRAGPAAEPALVDELRAAIEELPEAQRLVVKLRYYDEMSLKRIAQFLAVPLTTIKWRLHKAKQLLRRRLRADAGQLGGRRTKGNHG